MKKIKFTESLIALIFIPIMIKLHSHISYIILYDWIIYLLFNILLSISLMVRIYRYSNFDIIKNMMIFSYSVLASLCFSIYFIENTPFIFALLITIIGGSVVGLTLSISIFFVRRLTTKSLFDQVDKKTQ